MSSPILGTLPERLKDYLNQPHVMEVAVQDPWHAAKKDLCAKVAVFEFFGSPVEVLISGEPALPSVVRPDLHYRGLSNGLVDFVADKFSVRKHQVGYSFVKTVYDGEFQFEKKVVLKGRYLQARQSLEDFDPLLKGSRYAQIRQQYHAGERCGLRFGQIQYSPQEISSLADQWGSKKFGTDRTETVKNEITRKFGAVAASPLGSLYGVKDSSDVLRAAAAVICAGTFASIECAVSCLDRDYAMNYLEVHLWRALQNKGITDIEQGNYERQPASLLHYKEKFAPVRAVEWISKRVVY